MTNSLQNTSFLFIPFNYEDFEQFKSLIETLNQNEYWINVGNSNKYLLKYVADKIEGTNVQNRQCFRFKLSDDARSKLNIAKSNEWYQIISNSSENNLHKFQLESIQLYCFSTSVCIMAFEIIFEKTDPYWIASAQYNLKKVSRQNIICAENGIATSFLDIAQNAMSLISFSADFDFFFYANPSTERANMLTYLEVEPREDYRHELYYLKRCYNENFIYIENPEQEKQEYFCASKEFVWGISPEATVCLSIPALRDDDFIPNVFYPNFKNQYLFMYILLLHQKYVFFMFLTKLGIGTYNNLDTLESYRQRLYEFETDFMFYSITDVPQYQNLYEKIYKVFCLKEMYEDVREPLVSLTEIRRKTLEQRQQKRDENVNRSLLFLSLLTFFSALMDSFDFVQSFGGLFFNDTVIKYVQIFLSFAILGITIFAIASIIKSSND